MGTFTLGFYALIAIVFSGLGHFLIDNNSIKENCRIKKMKKETNV